MKINDIIWDNYYLYFLLSLQPSAGNYGSGVTPADQSQHAAPPPRDIVARQPSHVAPQQAQPPSHVTQQPPNHVTQQPPNHVTLGEHHLGNSTELTDSDRMLIEHMDIGTETGDGGGMYTSEVGVTCCHLHVMSRGGMWFHVVACDATFILKL